MVHVFPQIKINYSQPLYILLTMRAFSYYVNNRRYKTQRPHSKLQEPLTLRSDPYSFLIEFYTRLNAKRNERWKERDR